ncbi:MAG: ABC-F family ATP-binding cassette domain-containing protein [Pseudomonadota bacterium]|nr:ABC-F family ATP-binding cassette domain-containing protein [Pseudomonadota bacterium]
MLKIDNLTYRIGPRIFLDGASATIPAGHGVGLVGRNGTGKTTLLKLITRQIEGDGGTISVPATWRVGITRQEAPDGKETLLDYVVAADTERNALNKEAKTAADPLRISQIHERLADIEAHSAPSRAARILAGLGFDNGAQQRTLNDYSGGWRMRVMLASLLFTQPDLLLLDEPTNHLDLEAALWLEDYLCSYDGTVLIVSHDRGLLNRVVQEILHLEKCELTLYRGGYDRFEEVRRMRIEQNDRARAKQNAQRAHIQNFVDRFRYKATKAKQAQSRLKMLERMEPIPEHAEGPVITFNFPEPDPPIAPPLFSMRGASVGYGGQAVLRNLNLRIDEDDRIALIGANGNGKSTLIRLLAGRLEVISGTIVTAPKLRVGYFAQHQTDELDIEATPLIELARKRPNDGTDKVRSHLGHFGFSQERADTLVENLSGGEKARLLFALMTIENPHVLLLDEPTNHLDVDSRQALIQAINGFAGAVIIVSHDPHVLELTAERFWLVDDGKVAAFDGDMDEYRLLSAKGRKNSAENKPKPQEPVLGRNERRRQGANHRRLLAPLRKQIARIETNLRDLDAQKTEIETKMADPAIYQGDTVTLVALQKDLGWILQQLSDAEGAWLALQEEIESAPEC